MAMPRTGCICAYLAGESHPGDLALKSPMHGTEELVGEQGSNLQYLVNCGLSRKLPILNSRRRPSSYIPPTGPLGFTW